jgi:hypothetical protein
MSFIQMVWHNTIFKDATKEFFGKPALPDLMDRYIGLAHYLYEHFGTAASLMVGKTTELVIWVPDTKHVIVFSTEKPDIHNEAYLWSRNGSVTLREVRDGELERYSAGTPVRPEQEGYMLWINSVGLYQEHSEGSVEDLLSMRQRI